MSARQLDKNIQFLRGRLRLCCSGQYLFFFLPLLVDLSSAFCLKSCVFCEKAEHFQNPAAKFSNYPKGQATHRSIRKEDSTHRADGFYSPERNDSYPRNLQESSMS